MTEFELEKIIDKYSRLLWSISTKILYGIGNEQDAEECVADVFIDLWKDPDSFDSNRGNLKNWLCMKAKSKSICMPKTANRTQWNECSTPKASSSKRIPDPISTI